MCTYDAICKQLYSVNNYYNRKQKQDTRLPLGYFKPSKFVENLFFQKTTLLYAFCSNIYTFAKFKMLEFFEKTTKFLFGKGSF